MRNFKEFRTQLNEKYKSKFPSALVSAAVKIALDMGGNMTGAYKKIEKMKRGLGDDPVVKDALRLANEETVKYPNRKDVKKGLAKYGIKVKEDAEKKFGYTFFDKADVTKFKQLIKGLKGLELVSAEKMKGGQFVVRVKGPKKVVAKANSFAMRVMSENVEIKEKFLQDLLKPNEFKDELEQEMKDAGYSPKVIKKITKKGKGYEVRITDLKGSIQGDMKNIFTNMGASKINFKKGGGVMTMMVERKLTATKDFYKNAMGRKQKAEFDKLYKKLEGGKEHQNIKRKIKDPAKADDHFHALVMKRIIGDKRSSFDSKESFSEVKGDFPSSMTYFTKRGATKAEKIAKGLKIYVQTKELGKAPNFAYSVHVKGPFDKIEKWIDLI